MRKSIKIFLALILVAVLIIPYIIAAYYGNPSADDYNFASNVIKAEGATFISKVINRAVNLYFSWQGTYTTNFFVNLGVVIFYRFGLKGLCLEFISAILFFFFSIGIFVVGIFKKTVSKGTSLWVLLFAWSVVAFSILYDFNVSEVFYWHTGIAAYTFPFCMGIIAVCLSFSLDKGCGKVTLASVFALLSAGGSLNIAAFICASLLIVVFYARLYKQNYIQNLIVFLVALMGSLVNVLAPGNYSRHGSISESFPIVQSLKYAFFNVMLRNVGIMVGILTPFLFLLGVFLWNNVDCKGIKFVNPIVLACALLLAEVIIDFPVFLGYASNTFPSRCEFISRVTAVLYLLVMILDFIGWYKVKRSTEIVFNGQYAVMLVALAIIACIPLADSESSDKYFPFRIYSDLASGELERYKKGNDVILNSLENANDEDVVIDVYEYSTDIDYIQSMRLTDDPGYWVNSGTASYYDNVKSISVDYK